MDESDFPIVYLEGELSHGWERNLLLGILRESNRRGVGNPLPLAWSEGFAWDDRAALVTRVVQSAMERKGKPTVYVGSQQLAHIPTVWFNDREIGRMAARHLVAKGARALSYCGNNAFEMSKGRMQGVQDVAEDAGIPFYSLARTAEPPADIQTDRRFMAERLLRLPVDTGIVSMTFVVAYHIVEACRNLNLRVPSRFLLVSCDDDPLVTENMETEVSAVDVNPVLAGEKTMDLISEAIAGKTPRTLSISPLAVIERASTQKPVGDPLVAEALRLIELKAGEGWGVGDLERHLQCAPNSLKNHFQRIGLANPSSFFVEARLAGAKRLLIDTDFTVAEVASRSGSKSLTNFSNTFKERVGLTPISFRKQRRGVE